MGLTKDSLDGPVADTAITNHAIALKRDHPTITHIGVETPMNTNAQALAARGSNFTVDPAVYAGKFFAAAHAQGCAVMFRGTDCEFEGLYSFASVDRRNGHRYSFFGDAIDDTFGAGDRSIGYGVTIPAGTLPSTTWKVNHVTQGAWSINASGRLLGPLSNQWKNTFLFAGSGNIRDGKIRSKVYWIGNTEVIARATTDSTNFPGYGLQARDTNTLRIEKPGLSNLGQATMSFNWTFGTEYWLELYVHGTTIEGKAWKDGDAEPGSYQVSVTDSTFTNGYFGVSGETDHPQYSEIKITPSVDTATRIYRSCDWIRTNIGIFETNDDVAPFPEASSHWPLTNEGSYNQFFLDLNYIITRIGTENGKTLYANHFSHIWTSAIQQSYNQLFTQFGIAAYDHYGVALGLNERFGSFFHNSGHTYNQTYTVPTSITESSTTRHDFIPEKVSYNNTIDIFVVNKGTGDWTMTIHDGSNNPVQMCDHTNFSSKFNSYQVTIPNASLVNGQLNTFTIPWDNPAPDVTYHLHMTSTVGDGTLQTYTAGNLNTALVNGYKTTAVPEAIEIDIRKTYARTGVVQYLGEWGDYWSKDASRSNPVRTQVEHVAYLVSMYAAFQRLIDDGILVGFQYWRSGFGLEGIYNNASGPSYNYQPLYNDVPLQDFLNANPVVTPIVNLGVDYVNIQFIPPMPISKTVLPTTTQSIAMGTAAGTRVVLSTQQSNKVVV